MSQVTELSSGEGFRAASFVVEDRRARALLSYPEFEPQGHSCAEDLNPRLRAEPPSSPLKRHLTVLSHRVLSFQRADYGNTESTTSAFELAHADGAPQPHACPIPEFGAPVLTSHLNHPGSSLCALSLSSQLLLGLLQKANACH